MVQQSQGTRQVGSTLESLVPYFFRVVMTRYHALFPARKDSRVGGACTVRCTLAVYETCTMNIITLVNKIIRSKYTPHVYLVRSVGLVIGVSCQT